MTLAVGFRLGPYEIEAARDNQPPARVADLKNSMSLAFGSRLGLNGCAVALALTLAFPAGLLAQSAVTGTVSGTVSSQRQPVPGVTVRLTSPALQGERVVTTGSNGDYVALGLPPGEYVIQFTKPGMRTATQTATVDLSGTTRMDADLDVVAIEALTVRGDLPTPIATAQLGANYKAADLDKLPVGRTLAAIAVQAPGVVISPLVAGQIRINGAFGFDNVFLVDGTDVSDNLSGTAHNLFIEEAVAETAVLTGGIPAEYGRFTGGVVNAITRSGGNRFSGSVRLDLTNPDWTEKTPYEEERDIPRLDAIDEVYSATLGGPILRDRALVLRGRPSLGDDDGPDAAGERRARQHGH